MHQSTISFSFSFIGNNLKHRLVKHYGYEFNYKTNNVNKNDTNCEPIPERWKFIIERLQTVENLKNWIPDQLTVNHYRPGQGTFHAVVYVGCIEKRSPIVDYQICVQEFHSTLIRIAYSMISSCPYRWAPTLLWILEIIRLFVLRSCFVVNRCS